MEGGIHIHLAPQELFSLWGLSITNTLLTTWLVVALLAIVAVLVGRNLKIVPSKIQLFFESVIGFALSYMEEVLEDKALARRYLPLVLTLFFFILTANLLGLFPGVGSVGLWHGEEGHQTLVSFFYPAATDLNVTLALAIIAFVAIEIAGVTTIGFLKYAGKFVTFSSVIGFFVGFIELISEIARLITFSFRLFGNIFAGKVLILIATFFVPLVLPVPLMVYEVFVGIIQAVVFALLTLVFIKIAVTEAEAH
jgi:F-type H+-transporting ATPase subunit a